MVPLRELPPFLLLALSGWAAQRGSVWLAARPGSGEEAAPQQSLRALAIGAALCLALAAIRIGLRRAAARDGVGPSSPPLRLSSGALLGAEWITGVTFSGVALLPVLPDRRIPAAAGLAGIALLALRELAEGRRRRIPPPRGEERHWLAGALYANPRDRTVLVPARIGIGYTPNLGRPLGWLLAAAAVAAPALLAAWLAR